MLNLHDDKRTKPTNWVPVGLASCVWWTTWKTPWARIWVDTGSKDSIVPPDWAKRTKGRYPRFFTCVDGVTRLTRLFIGWVMGDQQEGDKYTGEPGLCHRCYAPTRITLTLLTMRWRPCKTFVGGSISRLLDGICKAKDYTNVSSCGIQTATMFVLDQVLL